MKRTFLVVLVLVLQLTGWIIVRESYMIITNASSKNNHDQIILSHTIQYPSNHPSNHQNNNNNSNQPKKLFHNIPDDESVIEVLKFHGIDEVQSLARTLMRGELCDKILHGKYFEYINRTLIDVQFGCRDLYDYSGMGTGNYVVTIIYGLRMVARTLGNIDVSIQCTDTNASVIAEGNNVNVDVISAMKKDLILPWLTGLFPGVQYTVPLINRSKPTAKEACTHYNEISLGYQINYMRYDLQRMATALVGVPHSNHPSAKFVQKYFSSTNSSTNNNYEGPDGARMQFSVDPDFWKEPIYPNTELDDAVLHFRCGDLIASNHKSFGFMKFRSFSRHISSSVQSIGIVTQPFEISGQHRPAERDQKKIDRCRLVIDAFVNHLHDYFPHARISIRNDINETIALTYARMIMANQTIVAISSFSVVPALATFGTGYIRKPDYFKAPNKFLLRPNIETLADNVFLIEEPRLMASRLDKMWGTNGTEVLTWFQSDV